MWQMQSLHSYDHPLYRQLLFLFGTDWQIKMNPADMPLQRLALGKCERTKVAFIRTLASMSPIVLR